MANAVLSDHHVVAPDLRGHGQSTCDAPWNLETHVDDLVGVLDHLGWGRVDVIGHSLGGNLAVRLLAAYPGRVRRLMLLDPAFQQPASDMTDNARATLTDVSYATQDELAEARRAGRSDAAIPHSDNDVRVASFAGEDGRWRLRYDRAAVVAMWGELVRPLPQIDQPVDTTLVTAVQAPFIDDDQRAYFRINFGERLTEIDLDLGHMLYWDDFDLTGKVVGGWASAVA